MLGIRRLNGMAIDLWCGDASEFVADALIPVLNIQDVEAFASRHLISPQNNGRHVCAVFNGPAWHGDELQTSVRAFISAIRSGRSEELPRRLTMIFSDVPTYKIAQQALFGEIPELEED